jgi:hypothetical protein
VAWVSDDGDGSVGVLGGVSTVLVDDGVADEILWMMVISGTSFASSNRTRAAVKGGWTGAVVDELRRRIPVVLVLCCIGKEGETW